MAAKGIIDKEFDKLIQRLAFFDSTRNSLLTFSFTAVLAVIGITIAEDADSFNPWICLIPFLLIIPFAARIAYYRLASAHINEFLKTFASDKMLFELGATTHAGENQIALYIH